MRRTVDIKQQQKLTVKVSVVLLREDIWRFASDDNRLNLWQCKGLAFVTQSNCRGLGETLSGTLTNPKANCEPDKDKLCFSFLSGSSCRVKFTASSLILVQSDCMWTAVWWLSGVSLLSCVVTQGHKCNFNLEPSQAFFFTCLSLNLSINDASSSVALTLSRITFSAFQETCKSGHVDNVFFSACCCV